MNLTFDTATLTPTEAQAAIVLLSTLFPSASIPSAPIAPQPPQTAAEHAAANGPTLVQSDPQPESTSAGRRRRTKAELAADALLAKSGHAPANAAAEAQRVAEEGHPEEANAILQEASTGTKPVTADELRVLLNGYIQKHSMEAAIDKLKSFGCNRVTEALALDPAKLSELAMALNG